MWIHKSYSLLSDSWEKNSLSETKYLSLIRDLLYNLYSYNAQQFNVEVTRNYIITKPSFTVNKTFMYRNSYQRHSPSSSPPKSWYGTDKADGSNSRNKTAPRWQERCLKGTILRVCARQTLRILQVTDCTCSHKTPRSSFKMNSLLSADWSRYMRFSYFWPIADIRPPIINLKATFSCFNWLEILVD